MLLFRREWHQAIFITVFGASIWFQFIGSERGDYQENKMQKKKKKRNKKEKQAFLEFGKTKICFNFLFFC